MGYGPRGVPRLVNGGGILWITSQILVYYSMGKTFNATVDWLGMVENGGVLPDQDVDPSVNGGKAQRGKDWMDARKKTGRFEDQLNPNDLAKYKNNINSVQQITRDQHEQMFPGTVDNSGYLSWLNSPAGSYTMDLDELDNDNPKLHHYFSDL